MPPLGLHMGIAKEIAAAIPSFCLVQDDLGSYYLGSTAPDIRVITRWERDATHFFDLSCFEEQDSVAAFFQAHPELRKQERLSKATLAFVSGYVTHLVLDETWISDIYRPYFGERSPMGGDARANVLDRVLQFELDRQTRADREEMEQIRGSLERAVHDVEVGFLDRETLSRWREVNLDVAAAPPNWERFRNVASRHLGAAGIVTEEALEEFMQNIDGLLQETKQHVSEERLEAFLYKSRLRAIALLKEYLL